jgi:hypothetical protein
MECIPSGRVSKKGAETTKEYMHACICATKCEADRDGTRAVDERLNTMNVVRRCSNEQRVIRIVWKAI